MYRPSTHLLLAIALLATTQAQAVVYITNSFSGAYSFVGQTNSVDLSTNISEPTFSLASDLAKIGVDSSSAADRFMASQWSTNSLDPSKYIEFSLTVSPTGVPLAYFESLQMDFALRRSSTGPRQFQWRSDLDGFATAITNFSTLNPSIMLAGGVMTLPDTTSTDTFSGNSFSLSGPSLLNVTNITLRLYGYQAESQFGQGGLDTPLGFSGEVVVPEPSTIGLLGLSAMAAIWWRLRRPRRRL